MLRYPLTNLSTHRKEFKTAAMRVPAVLHLSEELLPNDDTLAEIEAVAADPHVFHHVAALPDVHSKKGRKNPTGTAVATERFLLPQINDTAPNCGMRLLKTNLTDADLADGKIDTLFTELERVIPTKTYRGTAIPYRLVLDVCRNGIAPVKKYFSTRTKNEVENSFARGNFFQPDRAAGLPSDRDILDAIPDLFLHIGQYRLGILGAAGNHFLDLMKVSELKNDSLAKQFGVHAGQYLFLMHTGSGLLGQYASYLYTPKRKEHLSQRLVLELGKLLFRTKHRREFRELFARIEAAKDSPEYFAYDDQTPLGKLFITAHFAAANHGFANRVILTHHLDQALEKIIGRNPELELLYDMPHVYIHRESHFGKDVWLHRNGAVRANGPSRMQGHATFSQTGEPVFIPSSMSTPAFICAGTDQNESTFFSASHGTGRRKTPLADAVHEKSELFRKMKESSVRLYNAKSKGVVLQDRGYYKDFEAVMRGMEEDRIVNVVAKMQPVGVLMY